MDVHVRRFSLDIKHVLKEANLLRRKNGRSYKYDLVILFARVWLLKAEIFVHRSSTPHLLTTSVEDFIRGLHEGPRFLQKSFSPQSKQKTEHQILKLVEQVPGQVESAYRSSQSVDSVGNSARDLLYKFLVQVMLFKAEMLLLQLLKNEMGSTLPLKNQIGTLREGLIFFIKSDINHPKEDTEEEKLILADIEGLAVGVISLCNSCPADRVTDDEDVKNVEFQLSDLQMKVQLVKAKLKDFYFQIPRLSFPKTPGLGSIKSLLQNLKQLPNRKLDSLACATYQIEAIHRDLEFIICEHGLVIDKNIENQECIGIRTRLVDAAYQVEHVIDSMVSARDPDSQQLLWLFHLSEEIRHVKMELPLNDYYESNACDVRGPTDSYGLRPLGSQPQPTTPSTDRFMVGFNRERAVIIDRLVRREARREVVSITGMPGIGKTTLAQNVFCSPLIVAHFHRRVWCNVSQKYRKRELLLEMLSQISKSANGILARGDGDLIELLWKSLKRIRYLIVMDDVCSTAAWNDLQSLFPDDSNGSRILMTSGLYVVPNPHPLGGLSDDESWDLLKMKIFGHEACPEGLLEIGKQIAKNCKGLPLAIVIVAGHLKRSNMIKQSWEKIAESVSSRIIDQITQNMNVFELNYQNLPDDLKECFLYLGVFPKEEDISVWRLLWLWIAEGFINNEQSKSLEDVAEDYLTNLIERNLVIVAKRRSDGKVKTCRVHGQVLDFCLSKGKEARFSQLISGIPSNGSSDGRPFEHVNPADFINSEQYRLLISGDPEHFIASRPSGPFVRSLLLFATNEMYPGCHNDVSFISDNFKLLKVLDLESVNVGNTLEGIDLPVHLRYLAVGGDMDSLPSSLSKLQNLETLVVKGLTNKFFLPDTIWSMTKLRHVHVTNHCIFTLQNATNGSYSGLHSLVSLSVPSFSYGVETNDIIMRLPNLRELKCIFLEPLGGSMHNSPFPELGSLGQLESLKISYSGRALKTVDWNLPASLKKLTLSNFRLPWNQISAIGMLPKLEVLKVISRAFEGERWEITDGEFFNLKYLKLDSLNIVHWCAGDDPLPYLEQLVLRNCKQLEEVPSSFVEICTLQKIEVYQCGISVEESVRIIVEEQLELGNTDLISNFS